MHFLGGSSYHHIIETDKWPMTMIQKYFILSSCYIIASIYWKYFCTFFSNLRFLELFPFFSNLFGPFHYVAAFFSLSVLPCLENLHG